MTEDEVITKIEKAVESAMHDYLRALPLPLLAALDNIEAIGRRLETAAIRKHFDVWQDVLREAALRVGSRCPGCGRERKCKTRPEAPMRLRLLDLEVDLPKLYLECDHCDAPGVSITRLLTDLSSGATSGELELMAAYCAAEHSYGKARRDLEAHHGRQVERTLIRRMTLRVEAQALRFAEEERQKAVAKVTGEQRTVGPETLMMQGDGGTVRTGKLVPCARGDPGYGKKTARTGRRRRKRVSQNREVITLDVRKPGETEATALDVVVPVVAKPGERENRMFALAARKGLGDNTEVIGLGDLGSQLPESFDVAFAGRKGCFYSGDWKHTSDYIENAAKVLRGVDAKRWTQRMKDAVWKRQSERRDELLKQAKAHRVRELPPEYEKCPVQALATYVDNNWKYLQAARLKERGLEYVSARAEAQVRDRTKSRFRVPGAWREENLEGKATLRAIIAEGRWQQFHAYYLAHRSAEFQVRFESRLEEAATQKRLCPLTTPTSTTALPSTPSAVTQLTVGAQQTNEEKRQKAA